MKTLKKAVRIGTQVTLSGSLIACGIIAGLNPIGAMLTFTGVCLAFCQEEETNEEYNAQVRAHFSERGQQCPRWALKAVTK